MIRSSLLRRQFMMTFGILIVALAVALGTSMIIAQFDQQRIEQRGPRLFERLIMAYKGDRIEYAKQLNQVGNSEFPIHIDLTDLSGQSLLDKEKKYTAEELHEPSRERNVTALDENTWIVVTRPHRFFMPPAPPSAPHSPSLSPNPGESARPEMRPPPPFRGGADAMARMLAVTIGCLVVAVFLGSGLSMLLLFNTYRKKSDMAEKIISDIQRGNLKARFPITKIDEVSQLMNSFNRMADEIERLVTNLQENETARTTLLQELAHDLRTPIASLKNLVETLSTKDEKLSKQTKVELYEMSLKEIDYFERLIEDLLFLSQVMEPKYKPRSQDVEVVNIVQEQMKILAQSYPNIQIRLDTSGLSSDEYLVLGDEQLLTRLLRNSLENACSFAKSLVRVNFRKTSDAGFEIEIIDDGPGLDSETIRNFGKKRVSRNIGMQKEGRLSVGLGSVIMKTVTDLHQGQMSIESLSAPKSGARLAIRLPFTTSELN